jgi:ABC-type nitrate/sulfonate/bicarbonate transport system ATPase subunit
MIRGITSNGVMLFVEAIYLGDEILVMSPRPGRIAARFRSPFGGNRTRAITEDAAVDELEASLRRLLDQQDDFEQAGARR